MGGYIGFLELYCRKGVVSFLLHTRAVFQKLESLVALGSQGMGRYCGIKAGCEQMESYYGLLFVKNHHNIKILLSIQSNIRGD